MQMQIIFHVTIQKKRLQYPDDTPPEFKVQRPLYFSSPPSYDPALVMRLYMHVHVSCSQAKPGLCICLCS